MCVTSCASGTREECPAVPEAPAHSIHHLPIPREQRAAATTDCVGRKATVQVHVVQPGHTFLVSPDRHSKGTCEFLLQEEVSADRQFSELKLFQEILPVLYPACFSLATHQTLFLLWHLVFSTKPQHHQGTSLEVTCRSLHAVFTSSEASVLQL